jgi:hypothetical protein
MPRHRRRPFTSQLRQIKRSKSVAKKASFFLAVFRLNFMGITIILSEMFCVTANKTISFLPYGGKNELLR